MKHTSFPLRYLILIAIVLISSSALPDEYMPLISELSPGMQKEEALSVLLQKYILIKDRISAGSADLESFAVYEKSASGKRGELAGTIVFRKGVLSQISRSHTPLHRDAVKLGNIIADALMRIDREGNGRLSARIEINSIRLKGTEVRTVTISSGNRSVDIIVGEKAVNLQENVHLR